MNFQNGYITIKRTEACDKLQRSETNDCVVRAIANSTGCTYTEAHGLAKKHYNRGFRQGTRTIAILHNTKQLFSELNFKTENSSITGYFDAKESRRFGTINQFVKANPTGRHFLLVRGHALAVVNGVVYDNAGRTSGRHQVQIAFSLDGQSVEKQQAPKKTRVRFTITKGLLRYENLTPKQVHEIVGGNLASVQSMCAKRRPQVYGWTLTFE